MLEYLQAVSLLALIVGHVFLIRGCFSIREVIGSESGSISVSIDKNSDLLDELIQVVVDVVPEGPSSTSITQAPSGLGEMLSTLLINRMNMAHTDTNGDTKKQEWEIHPNQDNSTTEEATDQNF